jgi:hypothetical protein
VEFYLRTSHKDVRLEPLTVGCFLRRMENWLEPGNCQNKIARVTASHIKVVSFKELIVFRHPILNAFVRLAFTRFWLWILAGPNKIVRLWKKSCFENSRAAFFDANLTVLCSEDFRLFLQGSLTL